jgi:hypothetical protein
MLKKKLVSLLLSIKIFNSNFQEITLGFILCDTEHEPCGVGRVFDAQVK